LNKEIEYYFNATKKEAKFALSLLVNGIIVWLETICIY